jgi:MobA/MobL family protein
MTGHCHIELGLVQHSKGNSALARLAYQGNTYFNDGKRHGDYSRFAGDHLGGVILLPPGAPAEFADECTFVIAAGFREVRADAQAGRTIDFSLPRELPSELLLPVAAFAMAPFVAQGMAVRIDIECPLASDKGGNPHGHAYLAQRYLEAIGFGKKGREWNEQFLRNLGRYVRAVIAARVTLACALLGVAAYMDPRRNEVRGLQQPEERIPAQIWRMHDRGIYVAPIEKLKAARQEKRVTKGDLPGRAETSEGPKPVIVRNAVYSRLPSGDEERQLRINSVVPLALEAQAEARGSSSARAEIVLTTRDGSLTFDGETFAIEGTVGPAQAQLIVKLAEALDWPALVVEGASESTDEIIIAGAPVGMTAINTCASDNAVRLIKKSYGHLLADTIRPLDPCNVVDRALKTTSEKVHQADFDLDAPEPKLARDEENRRPSGASPFDPGMVVDHAFNGEPEKADHTDFDLDIPGPKSTRAEEEKRRQSAALFWENWLVASQDDRLQSKSGREVREHRTPPKALGKGPR